MAPATRTIILYGKPGCHLCDDAEAIVRRVAADLGMDWQRIDVTASPELFERFKFRVPVIRLVQASGGAEIDWPTTEARVRNAALAGAR